VARAIARFYIGKKTPPDERASHNDRFYDCAGMLLFFETSAYRIRFISLILVGQKGSHHAGQHHIMGDHHLCLVVFGAVVDSDSVAAGPWGRR
jgi:hypothetical protein